MILDTPAAERTMPTTDAAVPRMKRALATSAIPTVGPMIRKETIERIGGNADAESFFHDGIDEIEATVRNLIGKENTSTMKNPSAQNVVFEAMAPAIAPRGSAATSGNHDRISSPISRRKFRTLSP